MRLLAWAGVVILTTYLVFIGGGWVGIYAAPLRLLTMILAGAGLATWTVVAWRRAEWRPRTVLLPAIAASIGSLAMSTVFSRVPRVSLEYLGYAIVLAALYLLLVRLFADGFFQRRLAVLCSLFFVGISIAFVASVFGGWVEWWGLLGHLAIPPLRPNFEGLSYGNPSAALTMVVLLALPAAATFGTETSRGTLTIAAIVITVGFVALISGSRAGWLALAGTCLATVLVFLAGPTRRRAISEFVSPRLRTTRGQVLAVGLVIAALAATVFIAPIVIRRAGEGGENLRLEFAVVALRLFAESPIVGTGPGTWVIQRIAETQPSEPDFYIPHAHNLEVQTLAELGVVGAIAGLIVVFSLAHLVWQAARAQDVGRRRWAWVAGIGLLYFGLHQLLDFYENMPAVLFAAVVPIAYLDATTPRSSRVPVASATRNRRVGVAAVGALGFVAVAGLILQEFPALQQTEAVDRASAGDWMTAEALARSATAMDPTIQSYDFTAGLAAAHAQDHAAAVGYFQRVADATDLPEAWLNLAAEQWALDRKAEAAASLDRARRLGWQRSGVAMAGGDLALREGNASIAVDAFASAVIERPSLAGDPWWHSAPDREAVYQDVIDTAIARASADQGWEIALMANRAQQARQLADAVADPEIRLFLDGWDGDRAAAHTLYTECSEQPLDVGLLSFCGRLAGRSGDTTLATTFRTLAEVLTSGGYGRGVELRVNDPRSMEPAQGDLASFWGTFTYRRATPADMLVPSLVHLVAR